jgi:hypothetical protein
MRDQWPGEGIGLDNAVSCTRPRFWRRLLSGMRAGSILPPCAFKGGDQV